MKYLPFESAVSIVMRFSAWCKIKLQGVLDDSTRTSVSNSRFETESTNVCCVV